MAIEVLEANTFSTMSDVWSFGVLLWEMMTRGSLPFSDTKDQDVPNLIQSGQELPQPEYCPDNVYALMTACWSFNPLQRPKFETIEEAITDIVLPVQRGNQSSMTAAALYVNMATSPVNSFSAADNQPDIPSPE
jgi:serine/threonine protein kinase